MTYNIIRLNSVDWLFINIDHEGVTMETLEQLKKDMMKTGLENVFIFNVPITKGE